MRYFILFYTYKIYQSPNYSTTILSNIDNNSSYFGNKTISSNKFLNLKKEAKEIENSIHKTITTNNIYSIGLAFTNIFEFKNEEDYLEYIK